MDSEEIHSLVQEETRIRFGCNHTLNRKVNNRKQPSENSEEPEKETAVLAN
jgi:hypothetical protein